MGALASLRLRLRGNTRLSNLFCHQPKRCDDEDRLQEAIVALASQYGRCGYRRITPLLNQAGWKVGGGPGATHLAARRFEGSCQTKAARPIVAER